MAINNLNSLKIKFLQLVFGGFLFLLALHVSKSAMFGATSNLKMIVVLIVAIGIVLALDKNYWIFCPILQFLSIKIPGLPFDSGEIGCLVFIAMFFVRSAMRRDKVTEFKKEVLLACPYFIWVCIVWALNPTGMNILGSETLGARFYFKIVLSFVTMVILSRIYITEKQCKIVFFSILFANVLTVFLSMSNMGIAQVGDLIGEDGRTKYFLETLGTVLILLLCNYRIGEFLKIGWKFFWAVVLFGLVAYAGRRTMMGRVLVAPFVLMYFRGKDKAKTIVIAVFAAFLLGFVLIGQGRVYDLPFSVQRSLSFFPAKWDSRLENYGMRDLFREELHRRAKEHIKANPWVGRKGFAMDRRETSWQYSNMQGENFELHEYSGNWHNKFWGMGADFGLPASFSWYFFSIGAFLICWKRRYLTEFGTYRNTLYLFFSLYMFYDLIFAFGHSSLSPFQQWVKFAFLLALLNKKAEGYLDK